MGIGSVTVTKIALTTGEFLANYFATRSLDSSLKNEKDFKSDLVKVINNTLATFEEEYPIATQGKLFPFYHSQRIINELLKYRVMHDDEFNIDDLLESFQAEHFVIPPTKENIIQLFELFTLEISRNEKLKNLEIRETYPNEIFHISKIVTTILSSINNLESSFNIDLNHQWKNRYDSYVETLKGYKPHTALRLLESLEQSIEDSTNKPNDNFISLIKFQKGICYSFLQDKSNSCKSFITAYNLNTNNNITKEKAALSYFKLEELNKASILANDIIANDEFNILGWAVTLLIAHKDKFNEAIQKIPAIVKSDMEFMSMLYNNSEKYNKDLFEFLYTSNFFPKPEEIKDITLSIDTHEKFLFRLNICLIEYFNNHSINLTEVESSNEELLTKINKMISKYLEVISGTEIDKDNHSLKFILAYSNFILTKENSCTLDSKLHFEQLSKNEKSFYRILCANILQLSGNIDIALEMLNEDCEYDESTLQLISICYLKLNDGTMYAESVKKFITKLEYIDEIFFRHYIAIVLQLRYFEKLDQFTIDVFTERKEFENEEQKKLLEGVFTLLSSNGKFELSNLSTQFSSLTTDAFYLNVIAQTYSLTGHYNLSVEEYRKFIDKDTPSPELRSYIISLYNTKQDNVELIALLEQWRYSNNFDPELHKVEINIQQVLLNWEKCIEICEYLMLKIPLDEYTSTVYLLALHETNSIKNKVEASKLISKIEEIPFKSIENIRIIAKILIKEHLFEKGLELLYKYAKLEDNKDLYMDYFYSCMGIPYTNSDSGLLHEINIATQDSFVKYELDRKEYIIELNITNLESTFHKQFLGKSTGDTFVSIHQLTGNEDQIIIKRIMNKYLAFHDEILLFVSSNPYSGLPMVSFNLDENNKDIVSSFKNMFGKKGTEIKRGTEDYLEKYYKGDFSFSEIINAVFQHDHLDGYNYLSGSTGIASIPSVFFKLENIEQKEFVLDITSLAIVFQIFKNHAITPPKKFILSKYIFNNLNKKLNHWENDILPKITVTITEESVQPHIPHESIRQQNINYLTELLNWIKINCNIEISGRVLDFTRQMDKSAKGDPFLEYCINTILLVEDKSNRVLLSDDSVYLKYNLIKDISLFVSSELYFKKLIGENHVALNDFIAKKYIGFSYSDIQLNDEYNKKILNQDNSYSFCIENLYKSNNPNVYHNTIKHVKHIVLLPHISYQQILLDVINLFVNVIKYLPLNARNNYIAMVYIECQLLGNKLDDIKRCLETAIDIIDSSSIGKP